MTYSAMGSLLVDFMNIIGLSRLFKDYVHIDKRESTYPSDKIPQLLVLQNILGYDRIESVRPLNQDTVLKAQLGIENYPDPETFRDKLQRYTEENIGQLFFVNQKLLDVICNLTEARYVDLHFDAKVITVYGDQEGAEVGYNPHKFGRKSYHLKVCVVEPFGFILTISLESGTAVSSTGFVEFYQKSVAALPQNHLVIQNVRLYSGFFSEGNVEAFEGDFVFFEVVAKKYGNIKHWVTECIPEEDFEPFYYDESICGASFSFRLNEWKKPRLL
ncbi:MAG: transposase [Thermodesulfobacteriota bacterium]|nr:transposase [Thermodesulfobacteriota bacterium]